jgi:hypothetical protein
MRTLLAASIAISTMLACTPPVSHGGPGGTTDANGSGTGTGTDNNGDGGGSGTNGGGIDATPCASSPHKAEQAPLDMYVMLDQSGSMRQSSKWTNVTAALDAFVQQPNLDGFSVGIQYFGLNNDSCTASDYATPEVEIAPLPGVASAIVSSIAAHQPSSGTPTSAALQGAIDHVKTWETAHPDHVSVVVFATDGDPEECDTNLTDIDAIAAAGLAGTPKVLTFVIGVGSSLTNLNGIAAAGGTTSAFIVDTTGNINQQFLAAMNAIRGSGALGCRYSIPLPTTGSPDYGNVTVTYTPTGGSPKQMMHVADMAACPASGDAWYYDSNSAPTQIILCSSTCTTVSADKTGEIDVYTPCAVVVN